ncbi:hypothetical protein [Nocardia asteroides]|uniref:hypothetical protein n=1 Tax=Nocardia asteroides TaxID=1824 RepID=UPI001E46751E|nr:hypothetical protein [Nocardia asteroides]UGT61783.1 hypothetical protein LTT61_00015 [Nocardia asteroides]
MSVEFEFSSPLTLLRDWRANGWELTEALVIGYTVDLPFLERYFTSSARALGARVTIVSDARQSIHDDVDVRHAGRSYMYAPVLCEGAFHPKLAVLANDTDIWVALGSGNPTTSGWGHNRELWLTIRTVRASGPQALTDLATWLTDLPTAVTMPGWIGDTLADIALRLIPDRVVEHPFDELRILGNLEQPIIDQLPTDPVEELAVTAPFFDPGSRALDRLIQRLNPKSVLLGLQPNLSQFDGASLVQALQSVPVHHVRYLAEDGRLSHGKLVEWTAAGRRRALIGSPNISTAALLRTPRQAGNCELAVIHTTDSTLLPEGDPGTTGDLLTKHTFPAQRPRPELDPLTALGARLRPDGLEVELIARASVSAVIEISADGGPDEWVAAHTIETVEPGHHPYLCPVRARDGTAVRARTGIDGIVHTSRVVFATDPHRCRARTTAPAGTSLTQDYAPEAFFEDTDLAARFRKDLDNLLAASAVATTPTASTSPRNSGTEAPDDDRWSAWIASVEGMLKPSLTGLLFGNSLETIPHMRTPSWLVDIDEGSDITEDENEEDIDLLANSSAAHQRAVEAIQDTARAAWRKWDRRLRQRIVGAEPRLPVELRLLAVRLHLDLLAAGLRRPDETQWSDDLIELLYQLLPDTESIPAQARSTVGAVLAVGTSLLFDELRQSGGVERDFRAQKLWSNARHVIALAAEDAIDRHLLDQANTYSRNASRSAVELLVDRARISATDPTAEIRAILADKAITADFHDGAWVCRTGDKKNQLTTAATIATTVGAPCAALVIGDDTGHVVLWVGDDIAYAESRQQRWRLHRVVVGTPTTTLVTADGRGGARRIIPLTKPDPEITRLCTAIGVKPDLLRIALTGMAAPIPRRRGVSGVISEK